MGQTLTALIVLIAAASYSMFAFWFGLNDMTTIQSIERLPILLSPARFIYLITFVIFAGFIYYIIQAFKDRNTTQALSGLQVILIIAASFLQINFFFTWHAADYIPAVVMLSLHLIALFVLYVTYPLTKESIMKRSPIAMWFGWNLFFLFVIINYLTVYYEWAGFGLSKALWSVILLTFCSAIALHLRYHHADRIVPIIVIWSFIGILISNGFEELFVSTATIFLIGVLVVGVIFIEKKKKTA